MTEQKDTILALEKLEEIVKQCSEEVPQLIRTATENNLKAYYKKEITEEDYLGQRREIIDFATDFSRCKCK